jgi:hypothetical protein
MTDDIKVFVPGADYRADPDMLVLWRKLGVLMDVARTRMHRDQVFSVAASRLSRELRAAYGVEVAKMFLQAFIDSMDEAAKGDLPSDFSAGLPKANLGK